MPTSKRRKGTRKRVDHTRAAQANSRSFATIMLSATTPINRQVTKRAIDAATERDARIRAKGQIPRADTAFTARNGGYPR